jgi:hypothetical protein
VAQLFFEKVGPGVPPQAATFVGLAVRAENHVISAPDLHINQEHN